MAVIVNQDQEKDKKQQLMVGGQASTISAPSVGMGTPAAPQTQQAGGGGRFVNLQKYITAAGGKEAGSKIASKVGEGLKQQTEGLEQTTKQASTIGSQLESEKQRIAQAGGFAQQVSADPTRITSDPTMMSSFKDIMQGKTAADEIKAKTAGLAQTAQSQLGELQKAAARTGSESGRFELLRQSLGRPTYSKGQQTLDQLLLQSGGAETLGELQKKAQEQVKTGEQLVKGTTSDLQKQLMGLQQQSQTAANVLKSSLGRFDDPSTPDVDESSGAYQALQQSLKGRMSDYVKQQQEIQGKLSDEAAKARGTEQFSEDLLNQLGLKSGQQLWNVDLSQYIRDPSAFDPSRVTEKTVASPEDIARYKALAQLSGDTTNYLSDIQQKPDVTRNIDVEGLKQALKTGEETYQTAMGKIDDVKTKLGRIKVDPSQFQSLSADARDGSTLANRSTGLLTTAVSEAGLLSTGQAGNLLNQMIKEKMGGSIASSWKPDADFINEFYNRAAQQSRDTEIKSLMEGELKAYDPTRVINRRSDSSK